jgi:hypothetical protein
MRNIIGFLIRTCLIFSLLLIGKSIYADAPINLYAATVPIANQSATAQAAAFGAALSNVLIKVSGNPGITAVPIVATAIKQATQWVQSYNYVAADNSQIAVQFNPDQVNQLLTSAKQPVWSGVRPQTLVWLVSNDSNQSQLIGSDSNSPIPGLLQNDAAQRGLVVVFPLIDLQDLSIINPQSIIQYQPDVVRQASTRYAHDDILLANISAPVAGGNNNWQVNWTLLLNGAKVDWQTQAADQKTAIAQGMDEFANNVFTQHQTQAIAQPQANNNVTLTVYGINSIQGYSSVNQYLQQLAPVQSIALATMASDHVIFTLTLNSSAQALHDALAAGNILTPTDGNSENSLVYRVNS